MFIVPFSDYKKLVADIEKAEMKKDYIEVLNISLEAVTLLPSAYNLSLKKNSKIKNYKPLDYVCKYLTVLQEKEEIKQIKKIKNKIDEKDLINTETKFFTNNYYTIGNIINYIDKKETIYYKDLIEKFDLKEKNIEKIIKTAEEIDLIDKKHSNGKKIIKNKNCTISLQNLLNNKKRESKKNFWGIISEFLKS
ncbi:MAG: hypothetical protein ACQEQD_08115 [Bacillota bacterium]